MGISGLKALHRAASHGDNETIEAIFGARAPGRAALLVNRVCATGWTALHHACVQEDCSAATVRLLLRHGADANARTEDDDLGRTPLVRGALIPPAAAVSRRPPTCTI